jgi:lactoylglutathione lyase
MKYLHTMVRVKDLDASLAFYCGALGLEEVRRVDNAGGRFTLVFLAAPADAGRARGEGAPMVELTYNWDPEEYQGGRNFGHLAYAVPDIYAACTRLAEAGGDDQPSAARRTHGRSSARRRDLGGVAPGRRRAAGRGTLGVDAQRGRLVNATPVALATLLRLSLGEADMKLSRITASAAVLASVTVLAACGGGEREAESKTPVAEAEVSTTQPEEAISDQALQNAADAAAVTASTPEPGAASTGSMATDATATTTTTTTPTP